MITELCAGVVLGFNVGTYHFENQDTHKNINPGIYAVCKRSNGGIVVGTYENSNWRRSWHAGYLFDLWSHGDHSLAVNVGIVTGYPYKPIVPVLLPSYGYNLWNGFGIRIAFIPPINRGRVDGGMHLSIDKEF